MKGTLEKIFNLEKQLLIKSMVIYKRSFFLLKER